MCQLTNFFWKIPEKRKHCFGFYWNCTTRDVNIVIEEKKQNDNGDDNFNQRYELFTNPCQYHSWNYRIAAKKWFRSTQSLQSKHNLRSVNSSRKKTRNIFIDHDLSDTGYIQNFLSGSDSEYIPGASSQQSKKTKKRSKSRQASKQSSTPTTSKFKKSKRQSSRRNRKSTSQTSKKSNQKSKTSSRMSPGRYARRSPRTSSNKQSSSPLNGQTRTDFVPKLTRNSQKRAIELLNSPSAGNENVDGNANANKRQRLLTGKAKTISKSNGKKQITI